ncbi:DMT family transporter [Dyadobacter sp. CY261]|uniref:DMT family transporter n=1 Tax=Dyadobacter sp. CY261 TaxID=2907203 RepID=UPI001F462405|nr:DMT family transporter [Dyadobacter sp. CY261]MCF0069739.1 DMT family transporter [Dyadobacter sp. CY261]
MTEKNNNWIFYSIAAALCWGVWGVVAKLISENVNPYTNHFLFTAGMLATIPVIFRKLKKQEANRKGILWGLLSGVFAVIGNVAVFKSFTSGGLAAIVIPVTNLYPLVTIMFALIFFKEKLNWVNAAGILLAIPAVVLLSGQSMLFENPALFFRQFGLDPWMFYSMVALFFWGIFSATQKITTNYISAEWAYGAFIVSSVVLSMLFVMGGQVDFSFTQQTFWLGSLAGTLNGLGVLCSFAAYRAEGKASQVTTIAGALQPVFTILLAILFLAESVSYVEFTGIGVAIVAALLLSHETKVQRDESHAF